MRAWNNSAEPVLFRILLLAMSAGILLYGCAAPGERRAGPPPFPRLDGGIAVVGFEPALLEGSSPGMARSPITGGSFWASPVPRAVAGRMTDRLMDHLSRMGGHRLVSPSEAQGARAELISSDPAREEMDLLVNIARELETEAVLAGYIYRWRERRGREYAVDSPASVAFDLSLVSADNGRILWKGRFDMTQKSLSENVLEMGTFIEAGGKWMTAEQLALLGLGRLLGAPGKEGGAAGKKTP